MKVLDSGFKQTLEQESTYIAWCWLIRREDGIEHGFTSLDIRISIGTTPYFPFTGFTPTADSNSEGLEQNNSQDLEGILSDEQISAADLLAGKFDGAVITCFQVDVTNPPTGLDENPPRFILQYQRYIRTVEISDLGFRFLLRDDDYELEIEIAKLTSKFCDYDLGDERCGVDLTPFTFTVTITAIISRYEFQTTGDFTPGQFSRGKVTFLSGENAGIQRDINIFGTENRFTLFLSAPFSLAVGDEIVIVQGCGKTLFDCITRYNNAVNSDSEPNIPTIAQAVNTPVA